MSGEVNCNCITPVTKPFVFDSVQRQNAANAVYYNTSTMEAAGVKQMTRFKTDRERMQFLIGQLGVKCNPPTTNS